jgi:hypothetical protein
MTKYFKRAALIIFGLVLGITLHRAIYHPSQLTIPLIIIALFVLGVVVAVAKKMRQRRICPSCSQRGLFLVCLVRPDWPKLDNSVSYYRCKFCGKNYKRRFPSGLLENLTPKELADMRKRRHDQRRHEHETVA